MQVQVQRPRFFSVVLNWMLAAYAAPQWPCLMPPPTPPTLQLACVQGKLLHLHRAVVAAAAVGTRTIHHSTTHSQCGPASCPTPTFEPTPTPTPTLAARVRADSGQWQAAGPAPRPGGRGSRHHLRPVRHHVCWRAAGGGTPRGGRRQGCAAQREGARAGRRQGACACVCVHVCVCACVWLRVRAPVACICACICACIRVRTLWWARAGSCCATGRCTC